MLSHDTLWDYKSNAPNRTVINYASIKAGADIPRDIRDIPNGTERLR